VNLAFDAGTHTYRLNGRVVPSVTQLIAQLYRGAFDCVPEAILDRKRDIGLAVHAATELIDVDDLDESSVDPAITGYLDAYRAFLRAERPKWVMSETRLAHPLLGFAGTLDRSGFLRKEVSIVDVKTVAELHPAVGVQTAGYDLLHQHANDTRAHAKRYALQLRPDGTYKLQPYLSPDDYRVFLSIVSLHNWISKHE